MEIEEYIINLSKEKSFDLKEVIKILCSFIDKEDWLLIKNLKESVYVSTYGKHFTKHEADIEVSRMHIMGINGAFVPFEYCKKEYEENRQYTDDLNVYDFYALVNYIYRIYYYKDSNIKETTEKAIKMSFDWIKKKNGSMFNNVYDLIKKGNGRVRITKRGGNTDSDLDSGFFGYLDIN